MLYKDFTHYFQRSSTCSKLRYDPTILFQNTLFRLPHFYPMKHRWVTLHRNMQYDNATTTSFLLKKEVCHETSQAWPQERAQCLLEVVSSSRRQAYWVKTTADMCFNNTLSWSYHPRDWEEMLRWEAEWCPQSSWEYSCTVKHYMPRTYTKVVNKTVLLAKWDLFE